MSCVEVVVVEVNPGPEGTKNTSMSIWTTPVERRLGRRLRWIVAGVAAAFSFDVSFISAARDHTEWKSFVKRLYFIGTTHNFLRYKKVAPSHQKKK